MPNIGDLVTNLIIDASQHTKGTELARSNNRALSGSIDSIIGQLERQKRAMNVQGKTTQENILGTATKGASEGSINVALQLNEEVAALRDKKAAEDAASAARERGLAVGQSLIAQLTQERNEYGMTSAQIAVYRAAQAGATDADISRAAAIQRDIAAMKSHTAEQKAAEDAAERGVSAGRDLVSALQKEAAAHGFSATQAKVYTAAQAGANQEDIEAAMILARKERAQRQMDSAVASAVARTRQQNAANADQGKGTMLLTEGMRGLEDAVAGYTNNGLKGMLMATTNNINQIGSLIGGNAGLMISIGSIASLIGVSLIPMLYKWATAEEAAAERRKEIFDEQNKRHQVTMQQLEREYEYRSRRPKELRELTVAINGERPTANRLEVEGPEDSKKLRAREKDIRDKQIEAQNIGQRERERLNILRDRREQLVAETSGGILTSGEAGYDEYKQKIDELKSVQEEEKKSRQIWAESNRMFIDGERDVAAIRRTIAKRENEEKIRDRNRALQDMKEAEREAQDVLEADQKKREDKLLGDRKTLASAISQQVAQIDPGFSEQQSLKERRKEIEKAQKQGVITGDEKKTLLAGVVPKADPVAGGVAAVQAGSREAYSSIVRAMRTNEQVKIQEAQRKVAEDSKAILEKIQTAIENQEEINMVDF